MKFDRARLVEHLRRDGRTETADRIARMAPEDFARKLDTIAFRFAAEMIRC